MKDIETNNYPDLLRENSSICFSCANESENEEKIEEYRQQRLTRGWDDTETWNLGITIARFVLPRLKRFKELHNGVPDGLDGTAWNEVIQKMVDAFEMLTKDEYNDIKALETETAKANEGELPWRFYDRIASEGLQLFARYYRYLWW